MHHQWLNPRAVNDCRRCWAERLTVNGMDGSPEIHQHFRRMPIAGRQGSREFYRRGLSRRIFRPLSFFSDRSCRVETVPWSNSQSFDFEIHEFVNQAGGNLRGSNQSGTARLATRAVSTASHRACQKRVSREFMGAMVRVPCLFGRDLNRILTSPGGQRTNSHHRAHVFKVSGTKSRPSHHLYLSVHG